MKPGLKRRGLADKAISWRNPSCATLPSGNYMSNDSSLIPLRKVIREQTKRFFRICNAF
jgi:hypothetical protein